MFEFKFDTFPIIDKEFILSIIALIYYQLQVSIVKNNFLILSLS